jgi:hypothetical protein
MRPTDVKGKKKKKKSKQPRSPESRPSYISKASHLILTFGMLFELISLGYVCYILMTNSKQ